MRQLREASTQKRANRVYKAAQNNASFREDGAPGKGGSAPVLRINKVYDFAWTRDMWRDAAKQIQRTVVVLSIIYFVVASTLAYQDGKSALKPRLRLSCLLMFSA